MFEPLGFSKSRAGPLLRRASIAYLGNFQIRIYFHSDSLEFAFFLKKFDEVAQISE